MIEVAGADRYMTMDLHAGQIQGFFSIPGDVLTAFYIINDYMSEIQSQMVEPVVVTTDLGFAKKARNFAARMEVPIAFIEKRRVTNDGNAEAMTLIGDVKNRDVIIVDDEVNTGGSIEQAVYMVKDCVHPVFSVDAADRLSALPVKEFIMTDTIPISQADLVKFGGRLTVLTVAELLGEVILRANEGRSVGEMFNE
jgi:ribose-phosphate pyrophosphokinase